MCLAYDCADEWEYRNKGERLQRALYIIYGIAVKEIVKTLFDVFFLMISDQRISPLLVIYPRLFWNPMHVSSSLKNSKADLAVTDKTDSKIEINKQIIWGKKRRLE